MNMKRYNPWNIINQLNDFLDNSLHGQDILRETTSYWSPAVDIHEDKDKFTIRADLPGVKKEDIDLSVNNGILTIKGERKKETKEENALYSRTERAYGTFYRHFSLPDTANCKNVTANFESGVLRLSIPKKEAAKPTHIQISENTLGNDKLQTTQQTPTSEQISG